MSVALKAAVENTHDIIDALKNNGSLTKLVAAVKAAGLVETLEGAGPFTVFAPSDDAFKKMPAGAVENLLKLENKAELIRLLKYHAIAGRVSSGDLKGKKFNRKSIEGAELALGGTDGVSVNSVKMVGSDIDASNGVIHVIDTLLMPPKV